MGEGGESLHGFVINNFALGMRFLNFWIDLFCFIIPELSTADNNNNITDISKIVETNY